MLSPYEAPFNSFDPLNNFERKKAIRLKSINKSCPFCSFSLSNCICQTGLFEFIPCKQPKLNGRDIEEGEKIYCPDCKNNYRCIITNDKIVLLRPL